MQVKQIYINRSDWGADKGQLTGTVSFDGEQGEIKINIDHETAKKFLVLVAEGVAGAAQAVGKLLTADVIDSAESVPQLKE